MKRRFYIETWGCQMNLHHSEGIAGILEQAGFCLTDSLADADVILFNTCAVRQKAEEKVYGRIGAIAELKKTKDVLFGVVGCMAQVYGETLAKRFPVIDFLFGTTQLSALPQLLRTAEANRTHTASFPAFSKAEEIPYRRESGVRAMVTITEGCSNFCSYCIVPYARGPLRSRPPENILAEVDALVEAGYKEVLLLGQNVDSYGRDRPGYGHFPELLRKVAKTGIPRIRFTTSHPRDMTPQVFEAVAQHANICPHVHLACQSGSDRILRAMNRGYTREEFLSLVKEARMFVDGLNVTTDLIVGYPGETERDFRDTMDLINTARFGAIFVAKYSPRPRTRSFALIDDVPKEVKEARLKEVLKREREIALEENNKRIGEIVEVLVEGRNRSGAFYGRAEDHRTVVITGEVEIEMGALQPVQVEAASAAALEGRALIPTTTRGAR
jgi:tRNA-2-methylthio-N6-dimethylallyladenosine synthase